MRGAATQDGVNEPPESDSSHVLSESLTSGDYEDPSYQQRLQRSTATQGRQVRIWRED